MEHTPENLEHYSASQTETKENAVYTERPVGHRILSWVLILIVLLGFLGTCYWLAMYGRV